MPPLGRAFPPAFRHLWLASAAPTLGDRAILAPRPPAAPPPLATLPPDPTAIAAAMFARMLPWPLFTLSAGALADRLPRRTVVAVANAARATLIAALAVTIATGTPTLWLLYLV